MRRVEIVSTQLEKRACTPCTAGRSTRVHTTVRFCVGGATTITPYHHALPSRPTISRLLEECDTDSSIRCHVRPVLVSLLKSLAEVRRRRGGRGGRGGVHRERGGLQSHGRVRRRAQDRWLVAARIHIASITLIQISRESLFSVCFPPNVSPMYVTSPPLPGPKSHEQLRRRSKDEEDGEG